MEFLIWYLLPAIICFICSAWLCSKNKDNDDETILMFLFISLCPIINTAFAMIYLIMLSLFIAMLSFETLIGFFNKKRK